MLTINEGFGTIYDRFCKAEIIRMMKEDADLCSITEVDVGIPLLHSGGLGLDSLLVSDDFLRFQFVYGSEENKLYAQKFFPYDATYYSLAQFMQGRTPRKTDLLFGNYILEYVTDLKKFIRVAGNYGHLLFFESNHHNLGHSLVKILGKRFMIAPWVEYESVRNTTVELAVELLSRLGVRDLKWGMLDFPFFAPASGVSPFKQARTIRADFMFQDLSPTQRALINTGRSIERYVLKPIMSQSHMFWVSGRFA